MITPRYNRNWLSFLMKITVHIWLCKNYSNRKSLNSHNLASFKCVLITLNKTSPKVARQGKTSSLYLVRALVGQDTRQLLLDSAKQRGAIFDDNTRVKWPCMKRSNRNDLQTFSGAATQLPQGVKIEQKNPEASGLTLGSYKVAFWIAKRADSVRAYMTAAAAATSREDATAPASSWLWSCRQVYAVAYSWATATNHSYFQFLSLKFQHH